MFFQIKRSYFSIIGDMLQKITSYKPQLLSDFNDDTVFKIVYVSFLHIREFTYIKIEIGNYKLFNRIKFIRFEITFLKTINILYCN